jgi:hypothetical protein
VLTSQTLAFFSPATTKTPPNALLTTPTNVISAARVTAWLISLIYLYCLVIMGLRENKD